MLLRNVKGKNVIFHIGKHFVCNMDIYGILVSQKKFEKSKGSLTIFWPNPNFDLLILLQKV